MSRFALERAVDRGRSLPVWRLTPRPWKPPTNAMRVLLVPEVYRRDDLSANGTVTDAVEIADAHRPTPPSDF